MLLQGRASLPEGMQVAAISGRKGCVGFHNILGLLMCDCTPSRCPDLWPWRKKAFRRGNVNPRYWRIKHPQVGWDRLNDDQPEDIKDSGYSIVSVNNCCVYFVGSITSDTSSPSSLSLSEHASSIKNEPSVAPSPYPGQTITSGSQVTLPSSVTFLWHSTHHEVKKQQSFISMNTIFNKSELHQSWQYLVKWR